MNHPSKLSEYFSCSTDQNSMCFQENKYKNPQYKEKQKFKNTFISDNVLKNIVKENSKESSTVRSLIQENVELKHQKSDYLHQLKNQEDIIFRARSAFRQKQNSIFNGCHNANRRY